MWSAYDDARPFTMGQHKSLAFSGTSTTQSTGHLSPMLLLAERDEPKERSLCAMSTASRFTTLPVAAWCWPALYGHGLGLALRVFSRFSKVTLPKSGAVVL